MVYTLTEKLQILHDVKQIENRFGNAPLKNVDLEALNPDDVDVVGVGALIYRRNGATVLLRRVETPREWVTPGGGVDPGESLVMSTIREVKEETGLDCEIDGLIRIGWAPNYSPIEFREANLKRFGKESIGLLLVNFRGVEVGGQVDWSNDPSKNVLEVREFKDIPFDSITYSYRVMFVQQGLWKADLKDYPVLGFSDVDASQENNHE